MRCQKIRSHCPLSTGNSRHVAKALASTHWLEAIAELFFRTLCQITSPGYALSAVLFSYSVNFTEYVAIKPRLCPCLCVCVRVCVCHLYSPNG